MTIDENNILFEKAKSRKDGVYSYKGYFWVVKDKRFIAFATSSGDFYERFGMGNVKLGKFDYPIRTKVVQWLREQ